MTLSVLAVGTLIIDNILTHFEEHILSLELTNAREKVLQSLSRSGVRAATEMAATLQGALRQKDGLKTAQLYIVEAPDNRVVYYPDFQPGDKLPFGFIDRMFNKEQGTLEYSIDNASRYAAFTIVQPVNWLFGLSIEKSEMFGQRFVFLRAIGGITFAILCLNALVFSFFGHLLIQRMNAAFDCVKRIEEGELSARIPIIEVGDEIGTLQQGINAMGVRIEERTRQQQEAERARGEGEERLRMVLDSSSAGAWDWDMVAETQVWSERTFLLLGIPAGTPSTYERFMRALHPEDRERIDQAVNESLEQKSDYSVEMRCLWPDGSLHWLAARGRGTYNAAGKPIRMSGVLLDITESKLIEEKIHKLNAELEQRVGDRTRALEESNKELESFSYSVSHDLRTPLRSIDGFSRILLEDYADKLDADAVDSLQTIRAASQRMGRLIDDILRLSQITRSELHRIPVDLSEQVRNITGELSKSTPARSLESLIEPNLIAMGDPKLIHIALENLIGNAWKFTGKRPDAKIEFGKTTHEGTPAYFVRDNGVGFDMAYAKKLFIAFQRLHSAAEFPGTGVGLATVQRVIHRHGGRIWAKSQVGEGTTFYFTLPWKTERARKTSGLSEKVN